MLLAATAGAVPHPYILVSTPRAASSSFCEALRGSSSQVRCDQELLHPMLLANVSRTYQVALQCNQAGATARSCAQQSVSRILHDYWSRCPQHTACGFKLFAAHLMDNQYAPEAAGQVQRVVRELAGVVRSFGVQRVVLLERRNKTAQYASLVRAFATGDWGFKRKGHVRRDFAERVPQARFEAAVRAWYDAFRSPDSELQVVNVYFEEFLANQQVNRSEVHRALRFILHAPALQQH